MNRRKTIYTEEVFLLSTFSEFIKCWKSSRRSRLFIDSVNGQAFVNFSVFLGNPSDVHSTPRQRIRHQRERNKERNHPRKSNVITKVRENFWRKRGRRKLQQKQRVVFQLQRLLRRQHRQSAQLQLTSVSRPLHQRM